MFKNKILLITGGTGSFGNAVLNKFIDSEENEIRIFSTNNCTIYYLNNIFQKEIEL